MQLSSNRVTRLAQLTLIKTHVIANYGSIFNQGTANSMNQIASPDYWVWKDISSNQDTGMAVNLDELGGLTTAESTRVQVAFQIRPNGFVPSLQSDRALFGSVFSAAGGALTRASLLTEWQKLATEAEKVLATGVGVLATTLATDGSTTGLPSVLGDDASGNITEANLIEAENNG